MLLKITMEVFAHKSSAQPIITKAAIGWWLLLPTPHPVFKMTMVIFSLLYNTPLLGAPSKTGKLRVFVGHS